jgi:DNA-binding winged helix-turn-helix (wHTH) protein/tetratricopeptide (TPR) repeat protein
MRYAFGNCVLDTARRELHRDGALVPLEPKGYQVLLYLVEHADRVVTRDELLAHAWKGVYVTDTTVARCLTLIRKAVGDSGTTQSVVKTLHGHGYRLIAPVAGAATPPAAPRAPAGELAPLPSGHPPPPETARAPPVTAAASPHGERRQVSVLSLALTPAFALLGGVDVEAQQALLEGLEETIRRAVVPFGGHLLHLTSDRASVVFGVPHAQEDHAERAALAALALRDGWAALAAAWASTLGVSITLGIGVHTGFVVARPSDAASAATAALAGEVLPLAEHLARQGPGDILISAAVEALAGAVVRVAPGPAVAVAGRDEEVATFRVTGPAAPPPLGTAFGARHHGPFIGREGDLATLRTQLDHVRNGHGRSVGMAGPAGMGKTRLVAEFLRRIDPGGCTVVYGRCQSHGQHTPYLPLVDLVRRWWGIEEADTAAAAAAKAEAGWQRSGMAPSGADGTRLLRLLGGVRDAESTGARSPQELRAQAFAALHCLFLHHAEREPLVVVIEDAHWIDVTSEEYLTALAGRLAARRLLLLVTFRAGYRPPWHAQSTYSQLALAPFADEESRVLVRATRRGTPLSAQIEAQIVARAQGTPFFVEALTRTATEEDRPAATLGVPDTIHAILAARLDRLPAPAKHLAQVAAIIGPDVPLGLLRGLAALSDPEFDEALGALEATELLHEARLSPEPVYAFQHSLVQEVAYGSLLRRTRRELHGRAARLLEAQGAEAEGGRGSPQWIDGLERLTRHSLLGELWEPAERHGQELAMRAFARGSNREAVAALEGAIVANAHLPAERAVAERAVDLRFALRSALLNGGEFARALACVREAERLSEKLDDPRRLAQIAFFLSLHLYLEGHHGEAVQAGARAQALTEGRDHVVHALATYMVGIPLQAQGRYAQAAACFERSLEALDGDRRRQLFNLAVLPSVTSCAFLATCHAELGRFELAEARGDEGLAIAEAVGHPPSVMFGAWGAGWAAFRRGDADRATTLLERALGICREVGLVLHFPMVAVPLAGTYVLAGRAAAAVALLEGTLERVLAHGMTNFFGVCRYALAEALVALGRLDEATDRANEALSVVRRQEERGYEAYTLRVLGELARRRGDAESALASIRESLALAMALGMAPLQAHCDMDLATALTALRRPGQAREALSRALERYRALAMPAHARHAEAALASRS